LKHCKDILFILPKFSGGGAERVTLNLLAELYNRGYSVGIVVFDSSGPLLSMVPDNVPVYNLNTYILRRSVVLLVKKIRELSPKAVFSTLGYVNVTLLAISWLLPRKTKIWIREANLPSISLSNNAHPRAMTILYKLLYKKSDKLICTSTRMRNEFILDFLIPEHIIEILPNPIDTEAIRISALPEKRFDKGGICYIASGRLTLQKGFDRLLYWFSELENKKSTLSILGQGSLKDELIKQTRILNIQDRVKFVGFCNNPWQWYSGADVFLLSSRWEGMPNSALESLVCGTPVISTKESGGINDIAEQSEGDSVTIVTNDRQFIDAMNKVKNKDKNFMHNSLLPKRYRKEKVVSIVEEWINPHI
jgi:glycosyltransferase involved in cell wall biosynthesis